MEPIENTQVVAGEVLNWLQNTAGFVAEQAPLLAQEIIRWGIAEGIVAVSICAIVELVVLLANRYSVCKLHGTVRCAEDDVVFTNIVTIVTMGIVLVPAIAFTMQIAQAVVTPRLFLIEELSKLIR